VHGYSEALPTEGSWGGKMFIASALFSLVLLEPSVSQHDAAFDKLRELLQFSQIKTL